MKRMTKALQERLGLPRNLVTPRRSLFSAFLVFVAFAFAVAPANAQRKLSGATASAQKPQIYYAVKFICGPSSEAFQEGMVAGFAATAINILNPSLNQKVQFEKRVSRALPYQEPGPISKVIQGAIGPLEAIEIECNEIRQMLPSQMTKEFRTGYVVIHSGANLEVTAVYSARPRGGEISALDVQKIKGIKMKGNASSPPAR